MYTIGPTRVLTMVPRNINNRTTLLIEQYQQQINEPKLRRTMFQNVVLDSQQPTYQVPGKSQAVLSSHQKHCII